jgi:hypothetical protein
VNRERRPGRVLRSFRPVLLGVAGATAWLAPSATAANADAGTDYDPLLGGLSSTISSVSASGPEPAKPGAQQPAGGLSGAAGRTIELLAAATHVDPAQTRAALVSPVVDLVGSSVVETVLPAVAEVVPVTAPILAPPTAVMTGPSASRAGSRACAGCAPWPGRFHDTPALCCRPADRCRHAARHVTFGSLPSPGRGPGPGRHGGARPVPRRWRHAAGRAGLRIRQPEPVGDVRAGGARIQTVPAKPADRRRPNRRTSTARPTTGVFRPRILS